MLKMDSTEALEALSNILTEISSNPYDLSLHAQHIRLAIASGMEDQVYAARQMMTAYWPAGDEVWSPMIEARMQQGTNTLDDIMEVLALFQTAEEDYFSIPLLQKHLEFLVDRYNHFDTTESGPGGPGDAFSPEWTRSMLTAIVDKGSYHLCKSHLLWDAYLNWELEQLEKARDDDRSKLILDIEDMLLKRLQQPHSTHEQTFQAYSTFTTSYKSSDIYERLLLSASKLKVYAVKAFERREQNEIYLVQSNYSPEAYNFYITYERRARKVDLMVLSTLYERAITDTAKRRFEGAESAEIILRAFWTGYCDALRTYGDDANFEGSVLRRAVRSIPGSGEMWARYIRFLERTETDMQNLMLSVSEMYVKALSSGLIQRSVDDIVPLVLARAGQLKRAVLTNDNVEGGVEMLFKVLEDGIALARGASQQGDPRYRLEKYVADIYVNLAESPDLACTVWRTTAEHYKSSYLAWMLFAEALTKQGKYNDARTMYKAIISKKLDWPEAIFDAWTSFEHLYGSLDDLQECLDKVDQAQIQVYTRRVKEAENATYKEAQAASTGTATAAPLAEAQGQAGIMQVDESTIIASTIMDVDDVTSSVHGKKRKSINEVGTKGEPSKKTKTETVATLKRDRENSTVFVADLPQDVSEDDLNTLFKECGKIREIKITKQANFHVATVEFFEKDSVPAGLTRDKKRINGHEVSVHLAWQSTLYVTNFPEKADDEYMRQLFGKFGVVFDVRWPSKKFKVTRRFCYIQYISPDAAQAASSLHGKELEPGLTINVFMSNPERKKERTDAGADDREVYIAGLSKFATKGDLEKLFRTYGTVKEVRMSTDEAGHSRGFAFVEFDDETTARKALQANNHDLKNRRIAVTQSDARIRARHKKEQTSTGLGRAAEIRSRSVRLKGLPPATQEGLLQQAIERIVPVKRVEVFQDVGEATVELNNAADAGRLLLLAEPLQFNGHILILTEETAEGTAKSEATPPNRSRGMFVPRAAASRPRAGLGSTKKIGQKVSVQQDRSGETSAPSSVAGKGQDDFRKLLG